MLPESSRRGSAERGRNPTVRLISLPTILRFRGLRVVIHVNDHWPPHVHVLGVDRAAKIELGSEGDYRRVVVNEGLSRRELVQALVQIHHHRQLLRQRWSEIHGDA